MRLVAQKAPKLYREIHTFALDHMDEAKAYYHVSAEIDNIPDIDNLTDGELPSLFDMPDSRQVIHITYGLILQAKDEDGDYLFKDKLYDIWNTYEEEYANLLIAHIG